METINATVKPWGNSLAVILPKRLGLKANDRIGLRVIPRPSTAKVSDFFGAFKGSKLDTKKVLAELRNEEW